MRYEQALWKWFVSRAYKPGRWGYTPLDAAERNHLESCGINVEKSSDLEFDTLETYGDTFNPERTIPGLVATSWVCNCGTYGSDYRKVEHALELAVTGYLSLSDVIREVIAAGDDK